MLRVLGAGQADLFLDHLGREREPVGEEGRVVVGPQVVLALEVGADGGPEGCSTGCGHSSITIEGSTAPEATAPFRRIVIQPKPIARVLRASNSSSQRAYAAR